MKKELKLAAPEGIDEFLNQDDMINEVELLKDEDLKSTRFILLIGVRKDGSAYFRRAGFISGLEIDGLKIAIEGIADTISDEIP